MERLQVKAKLREGKGKGAARKARAAGEIPGIIYGVGIDPLALTIDRFDFDKALKNVESTNMVIDLAIDGKETIPTMLREYQVDVLKRKFLHVDFLKIDLSKKIKVEVPIHLIGTAPGVKEGGILEHVRRHLEVKCLPIAIPNSIDVDVSHLNIGDTVHMHEVSLPEGVEFAISEDVTLAAVIEPAAEVVVEPSEEAVTEPEVLTEKKAEAKEAKEEAAKEQK